ASYTGIPKCPVDSSTTVSMRHAWSQVAIAARSPVKGPKERTGWGSRSAGTATKWASPPTSMAAALGLATRAGAAPTDWSLRWGMSEPPTGDTGSRVGGRAAGASEVFQAGWGSTRGRAAGRGARLTNVLDSDRGWAATATHRPSSAYSRPGAAAARTRFVAERDPFWVR